MREAIALSVLNHNLAAMPEGLNNLISSKGVRLSGGQQLRSYAATYLVVSHHPFVLRQADHIIILNEGMIEAEEKPEDLNIAG